MAHRRRHVLLYVPVGVMFTSSLAATVAEATAEQYGTQIVVVRHGIEFTTTDR